jgi:cobalt/nickel transport system ATP-binding protein
LAGYQNHHPWQLSGGMRQRTAFLRTVMTEADILLLDEPSSFLDPGCRRNLIGILRSLQLTQVIATHDLDLVLDVCDRVIVLKKGEIFADGIPAEILTQAGLMAQCGLELPLSLEGCPLFITGNCTGSKGGFG